MPSTPSHSDMVEQRKIPLGGSSAARVLMPTGDMNPTSVSMTYLSIICWPHSFGITSDCSATKAQMSFHGVPLPPKKPSHFPDH